MPGPRGIALREQRLRPRVVGDAAPGSTEKVCRPAACGSRSRTGRLWGSWRDVALGRRVGLWVTRTHSAAEVVAELADGAEAALCQ